MILSSELKKSMTKRKEVLTKPSTSSILNSLSHRSSLKLTSEILEVKAPKISIKAKDDHDQYENVIIE